MLRLLPNWRRLCPAWIHREALVDFHIGQARAWLAASLLDGGEAAAIALASQLGADWFLTDDAAARLLAQQTGLEVHGSLGIVLWAAASGNRSVEECGVALERLARSSLWVSPHVLREARMALAEMRR